MFPIWRPGHFCGLCSWLAIEMRLTDESLASNIDRIDRGSHPSLGTSGFKRCRDRCGVSPLERSRCEDARKCRQLDRLGAAAKFANQKCDRVLLRPRDRPRNYRGVRAGGEVE